MSPDYWRQQALLFRAWSQKPPSFLFEQGVNRRARICHMNRSAVSTQKGAERGQREELILPVVSEILHAVYRLFSRSAGTIG